MATETKHSNLQLEHLFRAAFERTKSRFLSYFLSWLLFYAIGIGAAIVIALVVGLHFLIFAVTKSVAVTTTVGVISSVAAVVGLMYLGAWGTLATTLVLISEKTIGVMEAMREVRPLIWRYLVFSLLMTLFIFGLFPISIFTLFILLIVWMVWGAFSLFIFMEQKPRGLQALWLSKETTKGRFWGIFGRMALLYVAIYVVMIMLAVGGSDYKILNAVSFILSLVVGPFAISYLYEIYKNLPKVEKAETPKVWVAISIIGWVLFLLGIFTTISSAMKTAPNMMEDVEKQMMMKKVKTI